MCQVLEFISNTFLHMHTFVFWHCHQVHCVFRKDMKSLKYDKNKQICKSKIRLQSCFTDTVYYMSSNFELSDHVTLKISTPVWTKIRKDLNIPRVL